MCLGKIPHSTAEAPVSGDFWLRVSGRPISNWVSVGWRWTHDMSVRRTCFIVSRIYFQDGRRRTQSFAGKDRLEKCFVSRDQYPHLIVNPSARPRWSNQTYNIQMTPWYYLSRFSYRCERNVRGCERRRCWWPFRIYFWSQPCFFSVILGGKQFCHSFDMVPGAPLFLDPTPRFALTSPIMFSAKGWVVLTHIQTPSLSAWLPPSAGTWVCPL